MTREPASYDDSSRSSNSITHTPSPFHPTGGLVSLAGGSMGPHRTGVRWRNQTGLFGVWCGGVGRGG